MTVRIPALVAVCFIAVCAHGAHADEVIEVQNAREIERLFVRLKYAPADWQAGLRAVPRVYLADIPTSWREKGSKEMTVAEKKRLFFRLIAPIVLYSNEQILEDRLRAEALATQLEEGKEVPSSDLIWMRELAVQYQVPGAGTAGLTADHVAELLRRVDVIPLSLALAQCASESGWGTSRFADEGNSLFGQWSWSGGIKPAGQRTDEHGDHRIAAFQTTGMSVWSYSFNLNTNAAYREFRERREDLRRNGQPLQGTQLVDTLFRYSERGQDYVNDLKTIMRQNKLETADEAELTKMEIIRLVPKPSGTR